MFGGILLLVAFLFTFIHIISPHLPGLIGDTYRNNIAEDIDATALIYSESGDINDYLDEENGKYFLRLGWE